MSRTLNTEDQDTARAYLKEKLTPEAVSRLTDEEVDKLNLLLTKCATYAAMARVIMNTAHDRVECLRCATDAGETDRPGTRNLRGELITTLHHSCDLRRRAA